MKTIFILLMLVLGHMAIAQNASLHGSIKEKDGSGIEMALVKIGSMLSYTDTSGNFLITGITPGIYQLKISSTGYLNHELKITLNKSEKKNIDVQLTPLNNELSELTVTASMKEVSKSESPVPVEIYTPKFFTKNPTSNFFDAMQMVNGVQPQLNCNVCNTGDIHINGMEGPYTMITIDGMPIVSSLSTVYGLMGIPNSLVQRIEVVKGSASTLYGSEAVAGLINIITKNPATAPKLSIDIFGTSHQEFNLDAGFTTRLGKSHMLTGINAFWYDNPFDLNNDNFTDLTIQKRFSVFNKWNFYRKSGKQHTSALRYYTENRWGGEMQYTEAWRGTDSIYGESIQTNRIELIGNYELPGKENLKFQYSFNSHFQDSYYGTTKYEAQQHIGFVQLLYHKSLPQHELLAGIPVRYTYYDDNTPATYNSEGVVPVNAPQKIWLPGIFVQDDYTISTKIKINAGLRYDRNATHGNIFTPRFAVKYSHDKNNVFRVNAGTGYRVVNLFTEDHAALTGSRTVIIAHALKPEQSYNASLNYSAFIFPSSGFIGIDASIFYTYFTNRILPDYNVRPDLIVYDNLNGYSVSQGASLNLDISLAQGTKLNLGATYLDVFNMENDSLGKPVRSKQVQTPPLTLNYTFTVPWNKYNLSFDFTGKTYAPMLLPVLPNDFRPDHSPWFSIINLQVTKKFKKGWEIYAGLKNILNFVPDHPLMRPFDPFDKQVNVNNPYGYTFDTTYNYSSLQGIRGFLGVRWNLGN